MNYMDAVDREQLRLNLQIFYCSVRTQVGKVDSCCQDGVILLLPELVDGVAKGGAGKESAVVTKSNELVGGSKQDIDLAASRVGKKSDLHCEVMETAR